MKGDRNLDVFLLPETLREATMNDPEQNDINLSVADSIITVAIKIDGDWHHFNICHDRNTLKNIIEWTDEQIDGAVELVSSIVPLAENPEKLFFQLLSFSELTRADKNQFLNDWRLNDNDEDMDWFRYFALTVIPRIEMHINLAAPKESAILQHYRDLSNMKFTRGVFVLRSNGDAAMSEYGKDCFEFLSAEPENQNTPQPVQVIDENAADNNNNNNNSPTDATNSNENNNNSAPAAAANPPAANEDDASGAPKPKEFKGLQQHNVPPEISKILKTHGAANYVCIPLVNEKTEFSEMSHVTVEMIKAEQAERLQKKQEKVDEDAGVAAAADAEVKNAAAGNNGGNAVPSAAPANNNDATESDDKAAVAAVAAAADEIKKDEKKKKEDKKEPEIKVALGMEIFEQYSSPAALFYHENSAVRALVRGATKVVHYYNWDFKYKKIRYFLVFIGVRFAEVTGKLKGTATTGKTIQPTLRNKIVIASKDLAKIFVDKGFKKNDKFVPGFSSIYIQGAPTALNKVMEKHNLNFKLEGNKLHNKLHGIRVLVEPATYKALLDGLDGTYNVQERMQMLNDDGKAENNRATMNFKHNFGLDKMWQLAAKLWADFKITCTIRFGAFRLFFTQHDLDSKKIAALRLLEGVAAVHADVVPFKAWDPAAAKKANDNAAKLHQLNEEKLKKQREDAAEKNKAILEKKENKLDVTARRAYAATIMCPKSWEKLAATVNAKVEIGNMHNCEHVVLRWETKELAAQYGEGHELFFPKMTDAAAYVGDIPFLKTK
jgi:hypothetical protein